MNSSVKRVFSLGLRFSTLFRKSHVCFYRNLTNNTANFYNQSQRIFSVGAMSQMSPIDPSSFSRPDIAIIRHVSLNLDVDFDHKVLKGSALLDFEVLKDETQELILDVRNQTIEAIELENGAALHYTIDNHTPNFGSKLTINLPKIARADRCPLLSRDLRKKTNSSRIKFQVSSIKSQKNVDNDQKRRVNETSTIMKCIESQTSYKDLKVRKVLYPKIDSYIRKKSIALKRRFSSLCQKGGIYNQIKHYGPTFGNTNIKHKNTVILKKFLISDFVNNDTRNCDRPICDVSTIDNKTTTSDREESAIENFGNNEYLNKCYNRPTTTISDVKKSDVKDFANSKYKSNNCETIVNNSNLECNISKISDKEEPHVQDFVNNDFQNFDRSHYLNSECDISEVNNKNTFIYDKDQSSIQNFANTEHQSNNCEKPRQNLQCHESKSKLVTKISQYCQVSENIENRSSGESQTDIPLTVIYQDLDDSDCTLSDIKITDYESLLLTDSTCDVTTVTSNYVFANDFNKPLLLALCDSGIPSKRKVLEAMKLSVKVHESIGDIFYKNEFGNTTYYNSLKHVPSTTISTLTSYKSNNYKDMDTTTIEDDDNCVSTHTYNISNFQRHYTRTNDICNSKELHYKNVEHKNSNFIKLNPNLNPRHRQLKCMNPNCVNPNCVKPNITKFNVQTGNVILDIKKKDTRNSNSCLINNISCAACRNKTALKFIRDISNVTTKNTQTNNKRSSEKYIERNFLYHDPNSDEPGSMNLNYDRNANKSTQSIANAKTTNTQTIKKQHGAKYKDFVHENSDNKDSINSNTCKSMNFKTNSNKKNAQTAYENICELTPDSYSHANSDCLPPYSSEFSHDALHLEKKNTQTTDNTYKIKNECEDPNCLNPNCLRGNARKTKYDAENIQRKNIKKIKFNDPSYRKPFKSKKQGCVNPYCENPNCLNPFLNDHDKCEMKALSKAKDVNYIHQSYGTVSGIVQNSDETIFTSDDYKTHKDYVKKYKHHNKGNFINLNCENSVCVAPNRSNTICDISNESYADIPIFNIYIPNENHSTRTFKVSNDFNDECYAQNSQSISSTYPILTNKLSRSNEYLKRLDDKGTSCGIYSKRDSDISNVSLKNISFFLNKYEPSIKVCNKPEIKIKPNQSCSDSIMEICSENNDYSKEKQIDTARTQKRQLKNAENIINCKNEASERSDNTKYDRPLKKTKSNINKCNVSDTIDYDYDKEIIKSYKRHNNKSIKVKKKKNKPYEAYVTLSKASNLECSRLRVADEKENKKPSECYVNKPKYNTCNSKSNFKTKNKLSDMSTSAIELNIENSEYPAFAEAKKNKTEKQNIHVGYECHKEERKKIQRKKVTNKKTMICAKRQYSTNNRTDVYKENDFKTSLHKTRYCGNPNYFNLINDINKRKSTAVFNKFHKEFVILRNSNHGQEYNNISQSIHNKLKYKALKNEAYNELSKMAFGESNVLDSKSLMSKIKYSGDRQCITLLNCAIANNPFRHYSPSIALPNRYCRSSSILCAEFANQDSNSLLNKERSLSSIAPLETVSSTLSKCHDCFLCEQSYNGKPCKFNPKNFVHEFETPISKVNDSQQYVILSDNSFIDKSLETSDVKRFLPDVQISHSENYLGFGNKTNVVNIFQTVRASTYTTKKSKSINSKIESNITTNEECIRVLNYVKSNAVSIEKFKTHCVVSQDLDSNTSICNLIRECKGSYRLKSTSKNIKTMRCAYERSDEYENTVNSATYERKGPDVHVEKCEVERKINCNCRDFDVPPYMHVLKYTGFEYKACIPSCPVAKRSSCLKKPSVNPINMSTNTAFKSYRIRVRIKYVTSPYASALQWLDPEQTSGKENPYLFSQCQPIHARSILPCQDTPAVKFTYDAVVTAPKNFTVLMSAVRGESKDQRTSFNQPTPIPSYLLALAVGNLESRPLGPRSNVWAEKNEIERSAWEFAETEKYLQAAEKLCGHYVWNQYDLLVLPPSFPYGGMENPCLTFVTPTLLAGDRSQADVIIHEIMHSWTGNLVTNCNFEHFWLNEGFTVFLERKVAASLITDPAEAKKSRDFHSLLGLQELKEAMKAPLSPVHPLTLLVPSLNGIHPDDAFSRVPYEKGSLFLRYLEDLVGGSEVFDKFLRAYLTKFAKKSLNTKEFKAFILDYFKDSGKLDKVDWETWLYKPGMPPVIPNYDTSMTKAVTDLLAKIEDTNEPLSTKDVEDLTPHQIINLLQGMIERDPLPLDRLATIGTEYKIASSSNTEILYRWLRICIRAKDSKIVSQALTFVNNQGRMKYVRPIYRDLYAWEDQKQKAIDNFLANEKYMMHVSAYTLRKDLHLAETE